ncbi:unnamed protein product [Protopolystoma xenopodis]|uniref:Uncharacterized protein n=1 Tax=Protopolystoma xenopodis TaxID=117903 RepID=A0A448X863_9PLAT|nr:unnamed protein product [Protopolystoma xenopodis]
MDNGQTTGSLRRMFTFNWCRSRSGPLTPELKKVYDNEYEGEEDFEEEGDDKELRTKRESKNKSRRCKKTQTSAGVNSTKTDLGKDKCEADEFSAFQSYRKDGLEQTSKLFLSFSTDSRSFATRTSILLPSDKDMADGIAGLAYASEREVAPMIPSLSETTTEVWAEKSTAEAKSTNGRCDVNQHEDLLYFSE